MLPFAFPVNCKKKFVSAGENKSITQVTLAIQTIKDTQMDRETDAAITAQEIRNQSEQFCLWSRV